MRRKKLKYNSDYMSEKMDKALEQIEDKLSALYANAAYDINQKFSDFMEEHEKKDALYQERVFNGEMTEADFIAWRNREIVRTDRFKATIDEMSDMMVSTDQAAMALVNSAMPSVVAQSYNFTQALGWESANKSGLTQGTFQIYNARSVQKLIKDNPDILHQVDDDKDKTWNYDHINREITQGMIQGEPIQKIADRLQRVTSMDENAAVRNARTAMTAAENMGRAEAADDLKAQGIPMDEVWSATYDDRTRETHLELDGTVRDENGLFGVGIINKPLRFPADPEGDPEEIYNCRCRLSLQLQMVDHSNDKELYEEFMSQNFPETWETMQEKDSIKNALETYSKKQEEMPERPRKAMEDVVVPEPEKIDVFNAEEIIVSDENISKTDIPEPSSFKAWTSVEKANERKRDAYSMFNRLATIGIEGVGIGNFENVRKEMDEFYKKHRKAKDAALVNEFSQTIYLNMKESIKNGSIYRRKT